MGLFGGDKYERLIMSITGNTARNESVRMVYLSNQANELNLSGQIKFNPQQNIVSLILEGEAKALRQFIAFVQASFGSFEEINYRFEADQKQFDDYVQVA
jgi:acylphosphatase